MGCCWSALKNPCVNSVALKTTTASAQSSSVVSNYSRFSVPSGRGNGDDTAIRSLKSHVLPTPYPRVFSLSELKAATKNFRNEYVLGEGGFGKVYQGWIDSKNGSSGTIVAIKKLRSEGMQGFREWQSEVTFLGKLCHPHLVTLLGYCCQDNELLLVYEFMPKGSLEHHLFGRGSAVHPLPWELRVKILIGAARALAFLHSLDRKVIYRDFKASNILLDRSYNAKISDFGLATMGPTSSQSHVTTKIMGTHGYAAPEYLETGHLYVKSDVYGFGVVVVEMLTGLRALDLDRPVEQQHLADWVKPRLNNRRKLMGIMDSHLEGKYPSKSAIQVAQLALNCLEKKPGNRPSMQQIVDTLQEVASSSDRTHSSSSNQEACGSTSGTRQHHLQERSPLHPRQQQANNNTLPLPLH